MTIFHLADIDFNTNVPDVNGALWYVTEIEGWDSPAIRSSVLEAASIHGVVTTEGLYGQRSIVLKGVCKATTNTGMYEAMYYLQGQTNGLRQETEFEFSVEEDIERSCMVVRAGEVRTRMMGAKAFEFSVNLRADDPFKYGDWVFGSIPASTPTVLNNAGNARSYPLFVITSAGIPTFTCGTQTWVATASLPDNTNIEFGPRKVYLGSTRYLDRVDPASDWLWLEPGNNTVSCNLPFDSWHRPAWV